MATSDGTRHKMVVLGGGGKLAKPLQKGSERRADLFIPAVSTVAGGRTRAHLFSSRCLEHGKRHVLFHSE